MLRQLVALALPALIVIALSQLAGNGKMPGFVRSFFDFFGYIGNITLCIYCSLVAIFSLFGLILPDRTTTQIVVHIGLAILMSGMAYSFFRSARCATKRT